MEQRSGNSSSIRLPSPSLLPSPSSSPGRRLIETPWHAAQDELPIQILNPTDGGSRGHSICFTASIKSIESLREAFDPRSTDDKFPAEDDIILESPLQSLGSGTVLKYPTTPEDGSNSFDLLLDPSHMRPTLFHLPSETLPHLHKPLSDIAEASDELVAGAREEFCDHQGNIPIPIHERSPLSEAVSESNHLPVEERPHMPLPEELPTFVLARTIPNESLASWLPAEINCSQDLQARNSPLPNKLLFQRRCSLSSRTPRRSSLERSSSLSNKPRPMFVSRILNLPPEIQAQTCMEEIWRSWTCKPSFVKEFGSKGGLEGLSYVELTWLEAMASVRVIEGLSSKQIAVMFETQWRWKCPKAWIEIAYLISQRADFKRMRVGWIKEEDFLI